MCACDLQNDVIFFEKQGKYTTINDCKVNTLKVDIKSK